MLRLIPIFSALIFSVLIFPVAPAVALDVITDAQVLAELKNENYAYLDEQLDNLVNQSARDISFETQLHFAIYSFYRSDTLLAEKLDGWVRQRPQSPYAYLARGVYKVRMGWLARGGNYIKGTSASQQASMKSYFESARADFEIAKKINSKIINLYSYEIEIAMGLGQKDQILAAYNEAKKISPYSFIIHSYYLSSLAPRWGGSQEQMRVVLSDINQHSAKNPSLTLLNGRIAADRAYDLILKGEYLRAIDVANRAMAAGEYWVYFGIRGDAYSRQGYIDNAISDFESTLKLNSNQPEIKRQLAFNYVKKQSLNKSIDLLTSSFDDEPDHAWGRNLRGICYLNSGRYKNALLDFTLATELEPGNQEYLKNKNMAIAALNNSSKKGDM